MADSSLYFEYFDRCSFVRSCDCAQASVLDDLKLLVMLLVGGALLVRVVPYCKVKCNGRSDYCCVDLECRSPSRGCYTHKSGLLTPDTTRGYESIVPSKSWWF